MDDEYAYIEGRVNYYNGLKAGTPLGPLAKRIGDLDRREASDVYYFDAVEYLVYFDCDKMANTLFGDVNYSPDFPSIVKSRPVGDSRNSVLLKLNKVRHFNFVNDRRDFSSKKDQLIGRGFLSEGKTLRVSFLERHFGNPLCDVGHVNDFRGNQWRVGYASVYEQLAYKFILCWEGNDVASNLKYVMSSSSLAVATKPKFETWFMEGQLVGGVHYVEIKDDFSDLDEKIIYYSTHIDEAEKIIENANSFTRQFQDRRREDLISLLVLDKYFRNTIE